jgi:sulfate permease, SulP family
MSEGSTSKSTRTQGAHAPIQAEPPSGVARYIPILQWLPKYQGSYLGHDAIAGLTVWALLVPEAVAYSAVAGVPPQYGLYAACLAGVGYMIFGGSRHLFFGPDAAPAAVSAGVVAGVVGASASTPKYVSATAVLALLTGGFFVLFWLLRLGWIAKFFARPVLTGFIFGLGWFIAISQLPKLVGVHKPSGDSVAILVKSIGHIGDWSGVTVLVGVIALAAMFGLSKFVPKLPAAIIVVILGILAVDLFDLGTKHGVETVGKLPTGFHFMSWSQLSWHDVYALVPGALALLLVSFSQSVAVAKTYAEEYHEPFDANQELLGYGAGNLGAGALQGFATCGSLSKSAVAEEAGAKTPATLGVTAVLILLTVLFLTGLFKNLPETVLAAVIIHAVSGSMNPAKLARLWRANREEFGLAAAAAAGVILINVVPGIVIGVLASFWLLIRRLDHPRITLMGRSPDNDYYSSLTAAGNGDGEVRPVPGVLIYRFEAPLVFTNEDRFTDDLLSRVEKSDPRPDSVVVDCDAIAETDTTASDALRKVHSTLTRAHIRLLLARPNAAVMNDWKHDGVLSDLGSDAFYPTVREAVNAVPRAAVKDRQSEATTET